MKLPNAENAVVDIEKLRDYSLNPEHPTGRNKARVFAYALGLTAADAEQLRIILLEIARNNEAVPAKGNAQGQLYVVHFEMKGATELVLYVVFGLFVMTKISQD